MMFAFFSLSFPSGLALYWITSNAISIAIQYFVAGWGGLVSSTAPREGPRDRKYKRRIIKEETPLKGADVGADIVVSDSTEEEGLGHGKSGSKRQVALIFGARYDSRHGDPSEHSEPDTSIAVPSCQSLSGRRYGSP